MKHLKCFVKVLRNPIYFIISLIVAVIFYSFSVLIINIQGALTSLKLAFWLVIGSYSSMMLPSFINLVIISLLTGVLVSLIIFQIREQIQVSKLANVGLGGMLLGILVPACSACGLGLISVFGLSSIIAFLPFKGLEVGWLSILLLLVAINFVSKRIHTKVCKI